MRPNSKKNLKLLKQFPALVKIINQKMEPFGDPLINAIDDLIIKVQRSDGDFMYKTANNIGLGDFSCILGSDQQEQEVMRRGEYLFVVGKDEMIINRLDFPRNDDERKKNQHEIYVKNVFLSSLNSENTDSLFQKTKYLVWVSVEAWHKDNGKEACFGDFCKRVVRVTVHQEPKEGFEKLMLSSDISKDLRLDRRTLVNASDRNDQDLIRIDGRIVELCFLFQEKVSSDAIKEVFDKSGGYGASVHFGSVKILFSEMIGQGVMTVGDNNCWIVFSFGSSFGSSFKELKLLDLEGTLFQIRKLLRTIGEIWDENSQISEL